MTRIRPTVLDVESSRRPRTARPRSFIGSKTGHISATPARIITGGRRSFQMPQERRSWVSYWPVFVFAAGLGAGSVKLLVEHQRQDFIRDERLRLLESLVLQEYPQYTRLLFP